MSDDKRQKLIERVVKLFKLGEHRASGGQQGGTEAEMMLAVTKARELMAQHAISMAELAAAQGRSVADAIRERIKQNTAYTRKGKTLADYDQSVAVAVGFLTDTQPILTTRQYPIHTISMEFVGDEDDVAVASEIFMIWLKEVRAAARRVYGSGNVWDVRHTSYAVGYADRLARRAKEMVELRTQPQADTMALVVASKAKAIHDFLGPLAPPKPRKRRDRDAEAYWKGDDAGKRHNMQIGGTLDDPRTSVRRCADGVCRVDAGDRSLVDRCIDCHGRLVTEGRAAGTLPAIAPA